MCIVVFCLVKNWELCRALDLGNRIVKAVGRPEKERIAPFWTRGDVFQVRGIYEGELRSILERIVTYCHKIHNPLQPRSLVIHTNNEGLHVI